MVENTKMALIKFAREKRRSIKRKIKVDAKSLIEDYWTENVLRVFMVDYKRIHI